VKAIKMFGLAALAALMAMAFVGASSATAETTKLCSYELSETSTCITHVHETTLSGAKGKLLTSVLTVECDVLFLGDQKAGTSNPLIITGTFTYTNCGSCTVEEVGGGVEIKVLKEGHETAKVTGEGEVHVNCSGLNCTYNGEGLLGTGKGPLLSSETNGGVTITEQTAKKVSGLFCPEKSKLDITTTPLLPSYFDDAAAHYCVEYERAIGFYLNVNAKNKAECIEKDEKRLGKFGLVLGRVGLEPGTMVCVNLSEKVGLYKTIDSTGKECKEDDKTNASLYELGTIQ
jgi:hypothetical protein